MHKINDSDNQSINFQFAKKLVQDFFKELETVQENHNTVNKVLEKYLDDATGSSFDFKTSFPFHETLKKEADTDIAAYEKFWINLNHSFKYLQRRQDVFIAGINEVTTSKHHEDEHWVMSMGHYMGLFDASFIKIRPTGKLTMIRYAEFHCVNLKTQKITQSAIFIDVIGIMRQAGLNPLPLETGQYFVYPGPRNHDGLLFDDAPVEESIKTSKLFSQMVTDLAMLNDSGAMDCPPEILEKSWSKNMVWSCWNWCNVYDYTLSKATSATFPQQFEG